MSSPWRFLLTDGIVLPGPLYFLSCPWHLRGLSEVIEVADAVEWAERSQLEMWWGGSPPLVLLKAITLWLRGRNKGERDAWENDKREREKQRELDKRSGA